MTAAPTRTGNLLLDALQVEDREALLAGSADHPIEPGENLYEPGDAVHTVYFPVSGVISMTTAVDDDAEVEAATIGREGFAVAQAVLGSRRVGQESYMGQVTGASIALKVESFAMAAAEPGRLQQLTFGYLQALLAQTAYGAACNIRHDIAQRCARWLLQTHDRVDTDVFELRQEFLAMMLGARRPSVSVAAGDLQRQGLIEYHRGRMTIRHREGLEEAACECYEKVRTEYSRLVPLG